MKNQAAINLLQAKHINDEINNAPLPGCPNCNGTGEFVNTHESEVICPCVMLIQSDSSRQLVMRQFANAHKYIMKTKRKINTIFTPNIRALIASLRAL